MSMFEKASRLGLRFTTTKGQLSVEDLWQLPLTSTTKANLDDIAKGLHAQLKDSSEVSFVNPTATKNEALELSFEIVKHIIAVRLEENRQAQAAKDRADQKQKIMAIIERKKDAALESSSLEELQAALAAL